MQDDPSGARAEKAFRKVFNVTVENAAPGGAFLTARTRALHDWWMGAAQGAVPPKDRFDIVEHFHLAPHLYLLERQGPDSFRYRVCGEAILGMFGARGGVPDYRSYGLDAFPLGIEAFFDLVLGQPVPTRCRGAVEFRDGHAGCYESIDCPLLDGAGGSPRFVVGVVDASAPGAD